VKRGPYPEAWRKNISAGQKGKRLSEEHKAKLRRLKPPHRKRVRYGDHIFRSGYEARVAAALDALHVRWEYEPQRFDLSECSYTPDFYLPEDGCFWEVKGWYGPQSQKKVEAFRREHPDIPLVLFNKDCLLALERQVSCRGE
jgi:hypothetical protein